MTHDQPLRCVWGQRTRATRRPCPHVLEAAPQQAGRGRGRPHLLLHQASHRLPDGEGEDGGRRNCMSEERHASECIEDGGTK